jgi:hypothetical protein
MLESLAEPILCLILIACREMIVGACKLSAEVLRSICNMKTIGYLRGCRPSPLGSQREILSAWHCRHNISIDRHILAPNTSSRPVVELICGRTFSHIIGISHAYFI